MGHKVIPRDKPQPAYKTVPLWWYWVATALALGFGIFACEFYPVQLRWYGVLLAFAVSAIFFIPVSHFSWSLERLRNVRRLNPPQLAWVYATTNMKIQIDIFCRILAGYIWKGKVLANIWFFNLGYISGIKGLAFAQDLKLGIYCNVSLYSNTVLDHQIADNIPDSPASPFPRAVRRHRYRQSWPSLRPQLGPQPYPKYLH